MTCYSHEPKICLNCPSQGQKVGSKGPWDSPVVIVGEGPGVQEIRKGLPFVGPSGELIKQCWPEDLGFAYDDCFVINAMQCFVKGDAKEDGRQLSAVHACRDRVKEQIALAPRKLVLSFGRWAGISIMHNDAFKIMMRRGIPEKIMHPGREGESTWFMPVLHPAFLLRGQGNLGQFRGDIRRGVALGLGIQEVDTYVDPDYVELESAERIRELTGYIREIREKTGKPVQLGCDTETTGFHWWKDRFLCIGIFLLGEDPKDPDNVGYVVDWDRVLGEWKTAGIDISPSPNNEGAWSVKATSLTKEQRESSPMYTALNELLTLPREVAEYIWQNGKFDYKFCRSEEFNIRIDGDTYAASYTLDERAGGHNLEEIAKRWLHAPEYKDELKNYLPKKGASYWHVPKPILWKYLARDVKNTHDAYPRILKAIEGDVNDVKTYRRSLLPYMEMLARVEYRGFYVDTEKHISNDTRLKAAIETAQSTVNEIAGEFLNPNSSQQVSLLLYDRMRMTLRGKRPADTAKETLDKIYEENRHPLLKAIREYRTVVKAHSTYVKAIYKYIDNTGRVHSSYDPCRTTTGRLGSSEPNLQNIPRDPLLRSMYRSSLDLGEERVIVEGDYNTAELRALAALSGDEVLIAIFADPSRSLHDEVATKMYGEGFTGDQRIRAKAINFGIPYGREAFSIALEFDILTAEAQRLIDEWFLQFPQAAEFIAKCRKAPSAGQTLITAFGRKRRPGVVTPENLKDLQNEFANYFMQSTINDFTLQAACAMEAELDALGAYIVNPVHDALLVDSPKRYWREVREVMKKHMEGVPKLWIKTPVEFKVDFKIGTNWGLLTKEEKYND